VTKSNIPKTAVALLTDLAGSPTTRAVRDLVTSTSAQAVRDLVNSTSTRDVRDLVNSTSTRAVRDLVTSTSTQAVRDLVNSTSTQAVRDLVTSTSTRAVWDLVNSTSTQAVRDLVTSTSIRAVRDLVTSTSTQLAREFENSAAAQVAREWANSPAARLASEWANSSAARLAHDLARMVEPYQGTFASRSAWETALAGRMTRLHTASMLPDSIGQSLVGFVRLSRLSDATHTVGPYAKPVSELVTSELGVGVTVEVDGTPLERDAAAVAAGLSPDLIAFPPAGYSGVVFAAGFEFRLLGAPVPRPIEAADPSAAFHPLHGTMVVEVEQRLRQLVEDRLGALDGTAWVRRRVSETVRKRWTDRQAEERDAGRTVYAPIQYADFMDLADVIGQRNNWREAFEPVFRHRDDFLLSLRRLHPIRKAIAHGRPLGRADVLTLVSEATRILGALGLKVLN